MAVSLAPQPPQMRRLEYRALAIASALPGHEQYPRRALSSFPVGGAEHDPERDESVAVGYCGAVRGSMSPGAGESANPALSISLTLARLRTSAVVEPKFPLRSCRDLRSA